MFIFFNASFAQHYTHADTLRGSNGPGRDWWDVRQYNILVRFDLNDSSISGINVIDFAKEKKGNFMQIDLQKPMLIDSAFLIYNRLIKTNSDGSAKAEHANEKLSLTKDGNAWMLKIPDYITPKQAPHTSLAIYYHGRPRISRKPPWDGGIVWSRDKQGNPWISIACQGLGASVWYPCKDYQGDEPDDGASLTIVVPDTLNAIGNGRLTDTYSDINGTKGYRWEVKAPINNYDIIPYVGKYTHFGEIYKGEKGNLTLDYWVLDSNLTKAKKQFKEVPRMMKAFEYWFGPYPFYEDGYKLVDAPYLGMEHQSAVAYGNGYLNGYHGRDLSGTGVGMKWDFIIVHESGHEWFGNNITSKDIADSWIHEGFTNYSETLFTEYWFGKEDATKYIVGIRKNIENKKPIISPYGVNADGPIDIYYKASNMLHTIRQVINNDTIFRNILRGLNKTFYHETVTSKQIEDYISKTSKIDFSKVFDQYLRTIKIPTLEYSIKDGTLSYRWTNVVPGFNMPVKIYNAKGTLMFIYPKEKMQQLKWNVAQLKVDENFYIYTNQIN